ncbi:iron complex transport system permease protein [Haloactinopolyspora alba]|uniref:Iron complex transport system permease protein n=1 Tax=Haloactinopolyspora alba TaxID=648780 RepID=A0A2P8E6P9_9ACTN|nr:iron ABC transporter permease [Haloactinopolyspora alba]PSL05150.1 iron complex transport system permease protein [Haloactinopolyspora alba]
MKTTPPQRPARDDTAPVRPVRLTAGPLLLAVSVLLVVMLLGMTIGPAGLPVRGVLVELVGHVPGVDVAGGLDEQDTAVLWELRVPRVVLGMMVGGMLAIAGAGYQGVFRNPLADPYLLGVAAGAGLGATFAIVSGTDRAFVPLFAFTGGLAGVAATYALGRSAGGRSVNSLILAGVAVSAFFAAIQTYVNQRNSDSLREVYGWILGRLLTAGWDEVLTILPYVAVATAVIFGHRRLLDVLSVGQDEAGSLGVPAARVRLLVVLAATLGTAAAVAVSGLIGFVGIVVPHIVRMLTGTSYRIILPLSALLGAAFLVAADLAARTLISPGELPVGVLTAFIGAPFFTLVLRSTRRSW